MAALEFGRRTLTEFKRVFGEHIGDELCADLERDQRERATMPMLIPPHMINTMDERNLYEDPGAPLHGARVQRAGSPTGRATRWRPATSLHEADMWAVEGLTHRYPTKVLAEMMSDLSAVLRALHANGPRRHGHQPDPQVQVRAEAAGPLGGDARLPRANPHRCATWVVSGGDCRECAPPSAFEDWVLRLMDLPNIRDVRLATKALVGVPQHFLQDDLLEAYERDGEAGARARDRHRGPHAREPRRNK